MKFYHKIVIKGFPRYSSAFSWMSFLTAPFSTRKKWQQGTDSSQIRIMLEIENALSHNWNTVLPIRITMFISRATQNREEDHCSREIPPHSLGVSYKRYRPCCSPEIRDVSVNLITRAQHFRFIVSKF
jgi:hypothetical protein